DIEEFSDAPQAKISTNASTDIPVFNVPEIAIPKPEKKITEPLITDYIEKDQPEYSVASSSGSTDISLSPEIMNVDPIDDKPKSPEIIELVNYEPEISPDLSANDELKSSNEEVNTQSKTYPPGYIPREEREVRLRETAVKHGDDPDKFVTITEEDRDLARIFRDKMMADAEIIDFARKDGDDPEEYMELTRREKLICMEIKLRMYEDDGELRPYTCIYNGEEWKKNIAILQENGYLW
ncbi:6982_t:CDS:2, partial [Paraglomus brasilianum]